MSYHPKLQDFIHPELGRRKALKFRLAGGALVSTLFALHLWYTQGSNVFKIPYHPPKRVPEVGTITWGRECEFPEQECGSIMYVVQWLARLLVLFTGVIQRSQRLL